MQFVVDVSKFVVVVCAAILAVAFILLFVGFLLLPVVLAWFVHPALAFLTVLIYIGIVALVLG